MISRIYYKFLSSQFSNPHGIFGSILATYMNHLHKKQYQTILNNINIKKTSTILEIGFANGYLIKKILSKTPEKVYGIDISEDMVNNTKKKLKKDVENKKIELKVADVKDLPFENDLFDRIYTVNTMYFWDNPGKSFLEIKRTLKEGGIFLNCLHSKEALSNSKVTEYNFNKYSINEIEEMNNEAGLTIIDIIEIENTKSFCIISKKFN